MMDLSVSVATWGGQGPVSGPDTNMKAHPVPGPFSVRRGALASTMLIVGALGACGDGRIGDSPTGSGPGGTSGGTGGTSSTGAGGTQVIDPTNPSGAGWYETVKKADCSGATAALPATRIWRLSSSQWKNTVAKALGIAPPDLSAFPRDAIDPLTGFSDDSTGNKVTLPLASAYFDASDAAATGAAPGAIT